MRSSNISVGLMVIIVITSVTPAFTQNKDSAAKTAEPEPPLKSLVLQDSIQVEDVDNDAGKQLRVSWEIEPVETGGQSDSQSEEPLKRTHQYLIERMGEICRQVRMSSILNFHCVRLVTLNWLAKLKRRKTSILIKGSSRIRGIFIGSGYNVKMEQSPRRRKLALRQPSGNGSIKPRSPSGFSC